MQRRFFFIGPIVALSGCFSLIYQVVWDRAVRYNFGGDSVSSAVVTATFLFGLGLGALLFGRWRARPFRTYALVELGIGAYAIAGYYILTPLARGLGAMFELGIEDAEGLRGVVIVAATLFLVPPSILIGATLPLIFNCFIGPRDHDSKIIGALYGLNTAGAALGILAAPNLLLNHLSLPATLAVVGSGNLLLAVLIGGWGPRLAPVEGAAAVSDDDERFELPALPVALAFGSGFVTLAFEVSLFRTFALLIPSSPYTFGRVLLPFLLALAVGSAVFTRVRDANEDGLLQRVGVLFAGSAVAMAVAITVSSALRADFDAPKGGLWWIAVTLVVPMPLIIAGIFPLLLKLAAPTERALPRATGRIYVVNAVGSFCGAMLAQFVGFELLGTRGVLTLLVVISLVCGGAALWRTRAALWAGQVFVPVALVAIAVAFVLLPDRTFHLYTYGRFDNQVTIEGVTGVASLSSKNEVRVNGQYMSKLPFHPRHRRQLSFILPLQHREDILLLGLGGGGMVRELVEVPDVRRVHVVDWSHELPRLLQTDEARALLGDVLSHPKVTVTRCDARVAVGLFDDDEFDIIIDNLSLGHWVGSTTIKSDAYYAQTRRILRPRGVFVDGGNFKGDAQRRANLAAMLGSYPFLYTHSKVGLAMAAAHPLPLQADRIEAVLSGRKRNAIPQPYAAYILDHMERVEAASLAGVSPITDDLLIYEFRDHPLGFLLHPGAE